MKHLTLTLTLILSSLLILVASCSSNPEDKARDFVIDNLKSDPSSTVSVDSVASKDGCYFVFYSENDTAKIARIQFDADSREIIACSHTDTQLINSLINRFQNLTCDLKGPDFLDIVLHDYSEYEKILNGNDWENYTRMLDQDIVPDACMTAVNNSRNEFDTRAKSKFSRAVGLDSRFTVNEQMARIKKYVTAHWLSTPQGLQSLITDWVRSIPNLGDDYSKQDFDELYALLFPPSSGGVNGLSSGSSGNFTRAQAFSDAFNIGHQAGYSDGMAAARRGASHGYGYSTANSYSDSWIREQYVSGYMMGYDAGYSDGGGNSYPDDDADYDYYSSDSYDY